MKVKQNKHRLFPRSTHGARKNSVISILSSDIINFNIRKQPFCWVSNKCDAGRRRISPWIHVDARRLTGNGGLCTQPTKQHNYGTEMDQLLILLQTQLCTLITKSKYLGPVFDYWFCFIQGILPFTRKSFEQLQRQRYSVLPMCVTRCSKLQPQTQHTVSSSLRFNTTPTCAISKAPMHFSPSLGFVPALPLETVPTVVWLTTALSRPFEQDCRHLPLSAHLSFFQSKIVDIFIFLPISRFSTKIVDSFLFLPISRFSSKIVDSFLFLPISPSGASCNQNV